MINKLIECDCIVFMKTCKDKQFDLAIVDPPYGIGENSDRIREYNKTSCKDWKNRKPKEYQKKTWDNETPSQEYFTELFRISKNQIIWGGNYFTDKLPVSGGWVVWDKKVVMPTFSDGELAWCNFGNGVHFARFLWAGYRKCEETERFHPTQKPVSLYKWLLSHYARPGDKLLDTHSGSGSFRIAAHDMGFDLVSCEKDHDYCVANNKRYNDYIQQQDLFDVKEIQQLTFNTQETEV